MDLKSVNSIGKGEVEKPRIKPNANDLKLLSNELVRVIYHLVECECSQSNCSLLEQ